MKKCAEVLYKIKKAAEGAIKEHPQGVTDPYPRPQESLSVSQVNISPYENSIYD